MNLAIWVGTGYWVQVFSLIPDSSVSLSAGIQSAEDSVSATLGSNPEFSRGRRIVSFWIRNHFPVANALKLPTTNIHLNNPPCKGYGPDTNIPNHIPNLTFHSYNFWASQLNHLVYINESFVETNICSYQHLHIPFASSVFVLIWGKSVGGMFLQFFFSISNLHKQCNIFLHLRILYTAKANHFNNDVLLIQLVCLTAEIESRGMDRAFITEPTCSIN